MSIGHAVNAKGFPGVIGLRKDVLRLLASSILLLSDPRRGGKGERGEFSYGPCRLE
jgi:hypothetical protein